MFASKTLLVLAIASASSAAWGNYLGILRPPHSALTGNSAFYGFASPAVLGLSPRLADDPGFRVKLGFRPTRFLAIEGEYSEVATRASSPFTAAFANPLAGSFADSMGSPFASPRSLNPGLRSTGFGVSALASIPAWNRFSFYGRLGAYRGDVRSELLPQSNLLVSDAARGTRIRYGLGMQYDFTKALGIRAEYERYAPIGHVLPSEADADLFSVGVRWRF